MKRRNIDKHLKRLSEISGFKIMDLKNLLSLLDDKLYKLVNIIEILLNNSQNTVPLPTAPKEVVKVQSMENNKLYADFTNFFTQKPIYIYWDDNPMSDSIKNGIKGNNVKKLKSLILDGSIITNNTKENRKNYHQNYKFTGNKNTKKPIKKKKNNWKQKKKKSYYSEQSKLVCVMNTKTFQIIRIRKDEVLTEMQKRNWKKWQYVSKTAYKTQKGKYKSKEFYSKTDEHGNKINEYPLKNMFDKTIKVDLLKAYYIPKDQQIKIDGIKIVSTNEICEYKGKGYDKVKYITKEVANGMLPPEQTGRKTVGKKTIEGTKKMKLVKERIYIPAEKKGEEGKYVTKRILKEVTPKSIEKIYKPIEKVKRYKKLIKKVTNHISGKVFKYFKPKVVQATKFISSVPIIASSVYNDKKNLRRKILIEKKDRLGNTHMIPKTINKVIYKYPENIKPF